MQIASHIEIIVVLLLLIQNDQILQIFFLLAATLFLAWFFAFLGLDLTHFEMGVDHFSELLLLLFGSFVFLYCEAQRIHHLDLILGSLLPLGLLLLSHPYLPAFQQMQWVFLFVGKTTVPAHCWLAFPFAIIAAKDFGEAGGGAFKAEIEFGWQKGRPCSNYYLPYASDGCHQAGDELFEVFLEIRLIFV